MKPGRRDFEVFSLSFLDCICCGFGAIILLFILSMGSARRILQTSRADLEAELRRQFAALESLRERTAARQAELTSVDQSIAELLRDTDALEGLIASLDAQIRDQTAGREKLLTDVDEIRREIAALQKKSDITDRIDTSTPIGVPVETNYVAFVIDTSGSMRDPGTGALWEFVIRGFDETIRGFPRIKGVQFLDADGRFIIGRSGEWIPDSPSTRESMLSAVRRYQVFSNSNPVPGIIRAVRTLHRPDDAEMRMGIFIFGDEFASNDFAGALERLDKLNPADEHGKRKVTINAMGFPTVLNAGFSMSNTGLKYANLMRELTFRHGGAFVVKTEAR